MQPHRPILLLIPGELVVHTHFHNNNKSLFFLVYSKSSRSTTHNPFLIVELSLKQRLRDLSIICARAGSPTPTAMFRHAFSRTQFLLILSFGSHFYPKYHQLSIMPHQHHHTLDLAWWTYRLGLTDVSIRYDK